MSRSSRTVEALNLASSILGFSKTSWKTSPRISGIISESYNGVAVRRQPFSAATVARMEKFINESVDEDDEDIHILGYALFLLHCRARYSDAIRPECEPTLDLATDGSGYIQATTK
eukprot:1314748-Amphidinium_carterae.1